MSMIRLSPRAIIRRGDLYLVIRYHDASGEWFAFPGGGQRHGESLHEALRRDPGNDQIRLALKDALAQAPPELIPKWPEDEPK